MVASFRCTARLEMYRMVTPLAAAALANSTTPGTGLAFFSATHRSQVASS